MSLSKEAKDWIFGIVLSGIVVGVALVVLASFMDAGKKAQAEIDKSKRAESTRIPEASLHTVEHDGHTWIVMTGGAKGHFVHHPNCECYQNKEEKQ